MPGRRRGQQRRIQSAALALYISVGAAVILLVGCSASTGATSTAPPTASPVGTASAESLAPTPTAPPASLEPTTSPTLPRSQAPLPTPTSTLLPPPSSTPDLGGCYISPGLVSVKFTPELSRRSAQDAFAAANGLRETFRLPYIGWIRYEITDGKSELDKAAELRANPLVANALPVWICPIGWP